MSAQASALPGFVIPGQRLGSVSSCVCGPGTHIQNSSVCASIAGAVVRDANEPSPVSKAAAGKGDVAGSATRRREIISVVRELPPTPSASSSLTQPKSKIRRRVLPGIESIILGRVTRVQKRQATLTILVVLDDNEDMAPHTEESVASDGTGSPQPQPQQQQQQQQQRALAKIISNAASSTLTPDNVPLDDGVSRFQAIIRREDVRAVEKDRVVMDETFRVGDIVRANIISLGDQSYYYAATANNMLGVVMARSEVAGGAGGNMMFPVSWKEMRDGVTGKSEARKVAKPY